jgi:lysophospholipase L1-like esterase
MKASACAALVTTAILGLAGVLPASTAQQRAVARQSTPGVSAAPGIHPGLDNHSQARTGIYMNDFGELGRYHAANQGLRAPAADEQRVVFFGDSITDIWKLDRFFPGKGYINRGIGGQTTSQMLVRFRQDVIDLHPHVLLILAGTNDIAGNTGPISVEDIEKNYATMAELARFHRIVTIFSSVTPVNGDVPGKKELFDTRPASEILALNTWMKQYCTANGDIYLDYYSAMVDPRGEMKDALSGDGLHPNDAGFRVMAPLAQSAIDKAMQM